MRLFTGEWPTLVTDNFFGSKGAQQESEQELVFAFAPAGTASHLAEICIQDTDRREHGETSEQQEDGICRKRREYCRHDGK